MIAVDALRLTNAGKTLLAAASFRVQRGEFVAVLGANGTGKTTLLRTLAGVHEYREGSIFYGSRNLRSMTPPERAATIAHVTSDDIFFDRLLVRDVVAMGRYPHHEWWQWRRTECDERAIADALRITSVAQLADRSFDTLSSGERQRVWIALALAQEAPVLLLDEPTSHLDVRASQEILTVLRSLGARGKTIVCALHDLNEAASYADKALLLGEGRLLAFDAVERVLASELARIAYGVRFETVRTGDGALRIFPVSASP